MVSKDYLHKELSFLFELSNQITHFDFKQSFANYWKIAGVPETDEGKAISQLFEWIQDGKTNVTIKSRATEVLLKMTDKYPELIQELVITTEEVKGMQTPSYQKKMKDVNRALQQRKNPPSK